MNGRFVWGYVVVVFALTWLMDFWLFKQGGKSNQALWFGVLAGQMFIPALVAIVFRKWVSREGFGNSGLGLGKKRYYLFAFAIFFGFVTLSFLVSAMTPWLQIDVGLTKVREIMATAVAKSGKPLPFSVEGFIALMAVQAIVVGPVIGLPALFGEEYGWRGYLLPHLLPMGLTNAIVIHGVIWGLWHAPVIAMGHNYPGHPIAGIPMMTLLCIMGGAILAWLYLASGSIWVVSYAHGVLNQTAAFGFMVVAGYQSLLAGPAGAIGIFLAAVAAAVLWRRFPISGPAHTRA